MISLAINNLDILNKVKVESVLVGLKDFSCDLLELDISDIKELNKKYKVIVAINKYILNSDLDNLKDKLLELDKLNLEQIMFFDLSIMNYIQEYNLKSNFCYSNNYLVTNYKIIDFYRNNNINTCYISNEITFNEIKTIKDKTKSNIMCDLVFLPVMATTKRNVVSNYNKTCNGCNKKLNISNMNKDYIVEEYNSYSSFYYGNIVNHTRLLELDFKYYLVRCKYIEDDMIIKIINRLNKKESIDDIIGNDYGFLDTNTIYRVKQ